MGEEGKEGRRWVINVGGILVISRVEGSVKSTNESVKRMRLYYFTKKNSQPFSKL